MFTGVTGFAYDRKRLGCRSGDSYFSSARLKFLLSLSVSVVCSRSPAPYVLPGRDGRFGFPFCALCLALLVPHHTSKGTQVDWREQGESRQDRRPGQHVQDAAAFADLSEVRAAAVDGWGCG